MKHFWLLLFFSSFFFLSACSPQPSLTLSEMETAYDISLHTAFPSFSFLHKDDQNALQTQTELSLALLSSSKTLQWELTYASEKYAQEHKEASHIGFSFHLQDSTHPIPIFASGILDTLYTDQAFYFNIQDFMLFMGEGNAEVSFINLLAQQLAHKWVSLDNSERFWISIVETPDFSSLWSQIFTLLSSQLLKADFSSSLPTKEITGTIIALDDEYLINAQMFYDFLIQLVGLPLAVEELNLDLSTSGNVIGYTTLKNHQISHHRTLNYRSSTHTFTTTLTFSPNELTIELFNVHPLDITQSSSDISLVITLQPHNSQLYKLIVVKEQEKKVVRSLNTDIVLLPLNEGLEITFNWGLQLSSLPPFSTESLSFTFNAKEYLQNSPFVDFNLTGDVIRLSDLL